MSRGLRVHKRREGQQKKKAVPRRRIIHSKSGGPLLPLANIFRIPGRVLGAKQMSKDIKDLTP